MRQALYWTGPQGLGVDHLVEPGGYWRRVASAALVEGREQAAVGRVAYASSQAPAVLLELTLEWVRLAEFPQLPSRRLSHFVWDDETWARRYQLAYPRTTLYEVQPIPDAVVFRADYTLGNAFHEGDSLAKLVERARRYWSGEVQGQAELLIQGQLVIIRAIIER